MKILIYSITAVFIVYVFLFTYLSFIAAKSRQPGAVPEKLKPCPDTPNCVCSEYENGKWFIQPFNFDEPKETAWARLKTVITSSGGKIEQATDNYIWAIFKTKFWRFTDDVEFRLDADGKTIHVRSASRVGKGDLGANRKRVEELRQLFSVNKKQQ